MNRVLGITIWLLTATIAFGQSQGNPFDLKYRKTKPAASSATHTVEPQDSIAKLPATKPDVKPVVPSEDTTPKVNTPGATTSAPVSSDNPFEKGAVTDTGKATAKVSTDTVQTPKAVEKVIPPALRKSASRGFQIFFLLLSLLLLIFIVNVERNFVRDLWRVISNENYSSLLHRNQRSTMRQILMIMGYTVFLLQASLFFFHALRIFDYRGTLLDNIWITTGIVVGIYVIRHLVIRYLRWLFNNEKDLTLFSFDIGVFNTMVGLILLPMNVLILFGPESIHKPLVIMGIIVIGAAYLLRQLRWLVAARQLIANSLLLFFIYLCAVEILPLWAVSKLFW